MTAARRFLAPGRVNLIGEHTDYSGGLVLPAAIDRSISLDVTPGGHSIELHSDAMPHPVHVPADGSQIPEDGWGRYVAAMAAELDQLGRRPVGLRGEVASDLPRGAGLSSSAALLVAVATALLDAAEHVLDPMDVAAAAQRAEHAAVGVPVGIMDQAASLLGRADHALLLDCGTLDYRHVPMPSGLQLAIIDSGVARTLEGSGYAQRRAELEAGLPALRGRRPQDVDADELDELLVGLDDVPARRVRHVVTENRRVRAVEAALTGARVDTAALGTLFAEGHASLRDDFEVSTQELDELVELAYEHGAVAARMTGGGFGGAIVALVRSEEARTVTEAVVGAYDGPDRTATVLHCRAANGARRLD